MSRLKIELIALVIVGVVGAIVAGCGSPPSAPSAHNESAPQQPEQQAAAQGPAHNTGHASGLPLVPPEQFEISGIWNGQPFWARLGPLDPQYNGRVLKLVYTPPEREAVAGTLLQQHPWLLVDDHLRLSGWIERSNLTALGFQPNGDPVGYRVQREVERRVGDDILPQEEVHTAPTEQMVWPLAAMPVLIALAQPHQANGQVPMMRLFSDQPEAAQVFSWHDDHLHWGAEQWRLGRDENSKLTEIRSMDGTVLLSVTERKAPLAPAEALAREEKFNQELAGEEAD